MLDKLNYNIHNILTIQIVRKKRRDLVKDLNLPFTFFQIEEDIDNPDIIFNIGKFKPSFKGCYVIDAKYHVRENYIYCRDSEGRIRWEVEIFGFEKGNTVVNYNGSTSILQSLLLPDFLSQNLILRPLIEYKLASKDYFSIHASGVSKEGKAYIFSGRGGSFKTSLVMDLMKKDRFHFIGDDRIIIHNKKVLCFPQHLLTFDFRINNLPNENFRNILDKIHLIYYLMNNDNRSCEINISIDSVLNSLVILKRTNRNNPFGTFRPQLERFIHTLIANNKMEMIKSPSMMGINFGCYHNYMLAYSCVFPKSKIAKYWDDLRDRLKGILRDIPVYEMEIPKEYSPILFQEVLDTVKDF